mgnify:CR=1 FL=1
MGEDVLVISNLNYRHKIWSPKWYNPWKKVSGHGLVDVSLSVEPGKIIGLLGPNGAGKTTLLEAIAGLHIPERGSIKIKGEDSKSVVSREYVGFMPESVNWKGKETPRKWIHRLSVMSGFEDTVENLLNSVGLGERADSSLDTLSLGMRQRLSLATALIGMPELLLLDEPLNGLDPIAQEALKNLLINLSNNGTSVIISSHLLAEMERFVDQVVILHNGKIAIEGKIKDIETELNLGGKLVIKGVERKKGGIEKSIKSLEFRNKIDTKIENNEDIWKLELQHREGVWQNGERESIVQNLVLNDCTPHSIEIVDSNLSQILSAVTNIKKIDLQIQEEE